MLLSRVNFYLVLYFLFIFSCLVVACEYSNTTSFTQNDGTSCIQCENRNLENLYKILSKSEIKSLNEKEEIPSIDLNLIKESFKNELYQEAILKKEITSFSWQDSRSIELKNGIKVFMTPFKTVRPKILLDKYIYKKQLLISYLLNNEIKHLLFEGYSNISPKNYSTNLPLNDIRTRIKYSTLDNKVLIEKESSSNNIKSKYHSNNDIKSMCLAKSWSHCVESNLEEAGAFETLGCMVLGAWCAGGLAAGCLVDYHGAIRRDIYCE